MSQLRFRLQRLLTGNYNFSEIYQALPKTTGDYSPVQSPEPELLYYRDTEENSENNVLDKNQEETDVGGAYAWPQSSPPAPAPMTYTPLVPNVAANQDCTYNSTAVEHGPVPCASGALPPPPSHAIESPVTVSGPQTSQQIQKPHSPPTDHTVPEHSSPSKQTETSGGWFSGWFKSKPQDVQQETSEQSNRSQTFPASGVCPPPATFPPPSSTGVNPFSRKAGQQLG